MAGTYDKLNAALFAQMDKLAAAEGDALDTEIGRSVAVSKLAGNIVANAHVAVRIAQMEDAAQSRLSGYVGAAPRMLGDGR